MLDGECAVPVEGTNLLIVDDEAGIRTLLSAILSESGYSVRIAKDGFSALAEIRDEIPDILLSDLSMPGMSGFELLSVVRRRFPLIQTIAMSSMFSGDDLPLGVVADAYYEKGTNIRIFVTGSGSPGTTGTNSNATRSHRTGTHLDSDERT